MLTDGASTYTIEAAINSGVIDIVITAVRNGELDQQLAEASTKQQGRARSFEIAAGSACAARSLNYTTNSDG